jgi:hypothetical protein
MATSRAIRGVVTQVGEFSPRFDVVNMEPTATLTALLAGPIVLFQHCCSKSLVCWIFEISVSERGSSALPVRVCRSNQVQIPGRSTSREFRSSPDSGPMLRRKWPVAQSFPNRLDSLLAGSRGHQLSLPTAGASRCRNLGPYLWAFSHIVVQVDECHTAGVAAKAKTAFLVFITTLLTYSRGFHL